MGTILQNYLNRNSLILVLVGSRFEGLILHLYFLYRNQAKRLFIDGIHDIDQDWMNDLRSGCNDASTCLKIVPRFVWEAEGFYQEDMHALREVIASTLEEYSFDGLVLEIGFSKDLLFLFKLIRNAIGKDKQLILVAHPEEGNSFHSTHNKLPNCLIVNS